MIVADSSLANQSPRIWPRRPIWPLVPIALLNCRPSQRALRGVCCHPGKDIGVAQKRPRDVNDLLCVAPEMRDAVKDRCDPGDVEALNGSGCRKLPAVDARQGPLRFFDDGFKAVK